MNLKVCRECSNRTLCKYYDYWDPRSIDGYCKAYFKPNCTTQDTTMEQVGIIEKPNKPVEHKNAPAFSAVSKSHKAEVKKGDSVWTVSNGNSFTVSQRRCITDYQLKAYNEKFGTYVFRTKEEAESAAKILRYEQSK